MAEYEPRSNSSCSTDVLPFPRHVHNHDPAARVEEIIDAIEVLAHSPLIGHPASRQMRELVIGRRSRGYVALYRYIAESDIVFVLAIRSQREAGYV